jgi:hypothetical protein
MYAAVATTRSVGAGVHQSENDSENGWLVPSL